MFETLKKRYERNFVTKEQLQRYVKLGKITQQEYREIIREDVLDLKKEVVE